MKKKALLLFFASSVLLIISASAQNVGVDVASPVEKLDVLGAIRIGTTANTNAGTIRWNSPNFQGYDGTQWVNFGGGTLTGSGTATRVAFWSGTSALSSSANLYWDNTNSRLGVGLTNPLGVISAGSAMGNKVLAYDDGTNAAGLGIQAGAFQLFTSNNTSNIVFGYGSSGSFTENVRFTGTGNVGIGTSTPAHKLHISDDNSQSIYIKGTGNNTTPAEIGFDKTVAGGQHLSAIGYATDRGHFIWVNGADRLNIATTGNVGIGTTAPSELLDVNGKIRMRTGATTGYVPVSDANGVMTWTDPATLPSSNSAWKTTGNSGTVDGTNFIGSTDDIPLSFRVNNQKAGRIDNATGAKFNTFLGYQSGNVTTGTSNTAMGYQALTANIGGGANTAFGYRALKANTSGVNNTAVGYDALATASTALENTAVGFWALTSTTGNSNTAVGVNALKNNSSGSDNTAIGRYAGYDNGTPANSNTTGTKNTFIGSNAGYLNSTQRDRAVAIGYNAKVDASNAMVLGGTGVDAVNVGIGTSVPGQTLDVNGKIQMRTGATTGYVPVSDANGTMTWTNPTSLSITETDPQVSSTTTNYIPKWNGTTLVDGVGYDNGTNVGIGTTSPDYKLHISGSDYLTLKLVAPANPLLKLSGSYNSGNGAEFWQDNTGDARLNINGTLNAIYMKSSGDVGIGMVFPSTPAARLDVNNGTSTVPIFVARDNGTEVVRIADGGSVGIGTTNPTNKLDVVGGSISSSDNYYIGNTSGTGTTPFRIDGVSNRLYILAENGADGSASGTEIRFRTASTNSAASDRMTIINDGNVGIGTTAPGAKLEVAGQVKITGGTPALNQVLTSDANGLATWEPVPVGTVLQDADADTKIQVEESPDEDIIRFDAAGTQLYSMRKIAGGSPWLEVNSTNTLIGSTISTAINGSGTYNTAVGYQAAQNLTTGQKNTYYGDNAGGFNTTGHWNTMIGTVAGQFNNGGNSNTMIGANAGRNNLTGSGNVFLGNGAGENETGSDKLYIDNGNTATPLIYGNFGTDILTVNGKMSIGTAATAAYLDITGTNAGTTSLQLRSGNTGVGTGSNQITLGYSGSENYRHAIKTRHNSGGISNNSLDFYVWDYAADAQGTVGTNHVMTIAGDLGGSVGIGTTTPSAQLDVRRNADTDGDAIAFGTPTYLMGRLGETVTTNKVYLANTYNSDASYIDFRLKGTAEANSKMVIKGDGKVGIGTTSPVSKLHVSGATFTLNGYNTNPIELISGGSLPVFKWYGSGNLYFSNDPNVANIGNEAVGTTQVMVLTPSGNVGIGTTAPSANLDVVGTVEMFGAWTSKSANTVYQADRDGFIIAWAGGAYFKVITDGNSTPTTVRMEAEGNTGNAARPNAMCPVRKGDYWKVEGTSGGTPTVWWMPIGQ